MPPQARLGDKALIPADAHGCVACPHTASGPAVAGSPNVNVNGRPAIRVDDPGIHTACCGGNTWNAQTGSKSVFINGKPAHRLGDVVRHCGGVGKCIEGSGNVFVGGEHFAGKTEGSNLNTSHNFDGYFVALHDDGCPAASIKYRITGPHVDVSGETDDLGRTAIISTGTSSKKLRCEFMLETAELTEQPNY